MTPPATKRRASLWKKLVGIPLGISVGAHVVLLVIALLWVFRVVPPPPEKQVDFSRHHDGGGGSPSNRISLQKRRTHIASLSPARIAAVNVSGNFTLPEPADDSPMTPLSALGGAGLGTGLGGSGRGGGNGSGRGAGNGAGAGPHDGTLRLPTVRFFDQESTVARVAYVIDFSKSMSGKRQKLMRSELVKSVSRLSPLQDYQLIFFAGPAWVAGSDVAMAEDQKSAVVTSTEGRAQHWTAIGGGRWEASGRTPEATWIKADKATVASSVATIRDSGLVYGTCWKPAIDIALDLKPAPDVIYFMTDGIVSKNVDQIIEDLARTARRRKCVINTVAMMEPEAAGAMRDLATKSGGNFTMIRSDGSTTVATAGN